MACPGNPRWELRLGEGTKCYFELSCVRMFYSLHILFSRLTLYVVVFFTDQQRKFFHCLYQWHFWLMPWKIWAKVKVQDFFLCFSHIFALNGLLKVGRGRRVKENVTPAPLFLLVAFFMLNNTMNKVIPLTQIKLVKYHFNPLFFAGFDQQFLCKGTLGALVIPQVMWTFTKELRILQVFLSYRDYRWKQCFILSIVSKNKYNFIVI